MKDFSKLCTPAKVYFAIAVISIIIALFSGVSVIAGFVKLVFAFIWTFILSFLCDKGYKSLSWFLVLLPYFIILLAVLGIYNFNKQQNQWMMKSQQQQREGMTNKKPKSTSMHPMK
jgi:uncharacterized protein YacL